MSTSALSGEKRKPTSRKVCEDAAVLISKELKPVDIPAKKLKILKTTFLEDASIDVMNGGRSLYLINFTNDAPEDSNDRLRGVAIAMVYNDSDASSNTCSIQYVGGNFQR